VARFANQSDSHDLRDHDQVLNPSSQNVALIACNILARPKGWLSLDAESTSSQAKVDSASKGDVVSAKLEWVAARAANISS